MKLLGVLLIVASVFAAEEVKEPIEQYQCAIPQAKKMPALWRDMVSPCISVLEAQVKTEIDAAMTYLAMGAHFAEDVQNRPGFAKLFFKSASEEREHAIKIIEYLLMRGQLTSDLIKLFKYPLTPLKISWTSGEGALREALELETQVTRSIRNVIQICEGEANTFNDYHLVDYLTADFLGEQYHGQRDLAGKLSTLGKMMTKKGHLGEFLFDKKLLETLV